MSTSFLLRLIAASPVSFLLIAFLTPGVNDAYAGTMRASASPPIFLWTDENLSTAQHVATSISDTFGTIQNFAPGTFIGSSIPQISLMHDASGTEKISPTEKPNGKGNAFGWTIGVRGSNSNDNSSEGNAGGASSLSASGQVGGNGGAGGIVTAAALISSGSGDVGNTNSGSVPIVANPLPPTLLLFASGFAGLGLLSWRRKRKQPA